jgi:hypothetical protein
MGVWETLISVTSDALKEHPRKQVVRKVIALRNAMIDCQKAYDDYQEVLKHGNYDDVMAQRATLPRPHEAVKLYDPRKEWKLAICYLAESLEKANDLLEIYDPDVHQRARRYHRGEEEEEEFENEAVKRSKRARNVMRAARAHLDPRSVDVDREFTETLGKLDAFIRSNFKPEEVLAAQRYLPERWPAPLRFCGQYWLAL